MTQLSTSKGVTLIETIVFLVVIATALTALAIVFNESVIKSVDPVVRLRALELAQAQLDEILARKFDENTPTGGVPACGTTGAPACLGIVPDSDFDDVGDYDGFTDSSNPQHTITVSVVDAGSDLGLSSNELARLITVNVSLPNGNLLTLSAFKANF